MHRILERQLRRLGLKADAPPDVAGWLALLERVSAAYRDHEQDHYTLERSLGLVSEEMDGLHASLALERDRLRDLIASLGHGLVVVEGSGALLFVNPEAEMLLGWRASDLRSAGVFASLDPRHSDGRVVDLGAVLTAGTALRCEDATLARRDGTRRPVSFVCNTLVRDSGVAAAYLVFQDIQHHKRAEAQLRAAHAEAEAASRAKSSFVATMSHELRTPLHGLLGMLEQARREPLTPAASEAIEIAQRAGDGLLAILSDILDLSRIEAGRMEMVAAEFAPAALVSDVMQSMGSEAARRGIDFALEAAPDLPASLIGDAGRIRQVLLNLVGNALKFTERGGVVVTVRSVPLGTDQVTLQMEVADSGIGIAAAQLPTLFDSFTQGDGSSTRRHGGTGLGLAISRQLVQLMGGTLSVRSRPGEGSTFAVVLPLRRGEGMAAALPPPASAFDIGGLKVLVVEDTPLNQRILLRMLDQWGCESVLARDGREAVEHFARGGFDLVLMDCQMPVMDGFQATARIRELEQGTGSRIPVLAVTANAMGGDRQRCLEAGMDDFLAKPFAPAQLQELLQRWCPPRPVALRSTTPGATTD